VAVPELHVDVLIFGGGIAGLWTLARLRKEGYSCLLLESSALGAGQTIASQGIIHGGVKYALTGQASAASKAIAEMPGIWRACLRGEGEVDLRSVTVLSDHQYLWTAPGLLGRVGAFAASVSMRAGVERVPQESRPPLLQNASDVYRADEPVLDCKSVMRAFADSVGMYCRQSHQPKLKFDGDSRVESVVCQPTSPAASPQVVSVGAVVLAAGQGNQRVMSQLPFKLPLRQQLRPLHMVMLRNAPGPLFAHCVSASTTPRLTITSGRLGEEWVWYIGGRIAEEGVSRSRGAQIEAARAELFACLPELDFTHVRCATLRINRAEGVPSDAPESGEPRRPDAPTVASNGNVIVGWPTKLAFAPLFAREVVESLKRMGVDPSGETAKLSGVGARVAPARFPWEVVTKETDEVLCEVDVEWT
jgi:glycine/D-amino acid oxidase-like deaminating enzyme